MTKKDGRIPSDKFASPLLPLCLLQRFVAIAAAGLSGKPTSADIELKPDEVRDFAELYVRTAPAATVGTEKATPRSRWRIPFISPSPATTQSVVSLLEGVPVMLMPAFAKSAGGTLTEEQIEILVHGIRRVGQTGRLARRKPAALCRDHNG